MYLSLVIKLKKEVDKNWANEIGERIKNEIYDYDEELSPIEDVTWEIHKTEPIISDEQE